MVIATVSAEAAGQRLDRWVAEQLPGVSRTRVQELIAEGHVRVDGRSAKAAHRLQAGEQIEVEAEPRPPLRAEAEAIPLDILYEDADVLVVNKPAGMVVHAGAGKAAQSGTLVNALLGHHAQLSRGWEAGGLRPGIVHRLDKETSGCIVVACNDAAHAALAAQFASRRVEKTYLALLHGTLQSSGRIELAIARDAKRRTRMTAGPSAKNGRSARTDWRVLLPFVPGTGGAKNASPGVSLTLAEIELHTGRTHQIRAHFSALKHPVVGDTLYGAPAEIHVGQKILPPLPRNFLHAARILFYHPRTDEPVEVRAPLPAELKNYLEQAAQVCGVPAERIDAALRGYL